MRVSHFLPLLFLILSSALSQQSPTSSNEPSSIPNPASNSSSASSHRIPNWKTASITRTTRPSSTISTSSSAFSGVFRHHASNTSSTTLTRQTPAPLDDYSKSLTVPSCNTTLDTCHHDRLNRTQPFFASDFMDDIKIIQCNSLNDEHRNVPLCESLSAGCVSTEVNAYLHNGTVLVGQSIADLKPERTLKALYLDPILGIIQAQTRCIDEKIEEVVQDIPRLFGGRSMVLMLNLQHAQPAFVPAIENLLGPLRDSQYLSDWTLKQGFVRGAISVVATGAVSFSDMISNTTYRDIFFDASLAELSMPDSPYNMTNSYTASAKLSEAVSGDLEDGGLSEDQLQAVKEQVGKATKLGLKSRYRNVPTGSESVREADWGQLMEAGVSIMDADDLDEFALFLEHDKMKRRKKKPSDTKV